MKKKVIIGSIAVIVCLMSMLTWAIVVGSARTIKANTAAYEALLDKIYGSAKDRGHGEELLHHRIQEVIKTCMESKGWGYAPPAYGGSSAGVVSPGDLDIATPLSDSFGIAERHRAHARGVEADHNSGGNKAGIEAGRSQETGAAYSTAGDECMSKAMPLEDDYHPTGQQEVVSRLLAELRQVQLSKAAKPLIADYQGCLHNAGYKANSRFELYEHTLKQFPNPEKPWPQMADMKQWQKAVQAERKAAATDKECRTKLYRWATGQIRPTVGRLTMDPKVAALQRGWRQIEAEHKAAGL